MDLFGFWGLASLVIGILESEQIIRWECSFWRNCMILTRKIDIWVSGMRRLSVIYYSGGAGETQPQRYPSFIERSVDPTERAWGSGMSWAWKRNDHLFMWMAVWRRQRYPFDESCWVWWLNPVLAHRRSIIPCMNQCGTSKNCYWSAEPWTNVMKSASDQVSFEPNSVDRGSQHYDRSRYASAALTQKQQIFIDLYCRVCSRIWVLLRRIGFVEKARDIDGANSSRRCFMEYYCYFPEWYGSDEKLFLSDEMMIMNWMKNIQVVRSVPYCILNVSWLFSRKKLLVRGVRRSGDRLATASPEICRPHFSGFVKFYAFDYRQQPACSVRCKNGPGQLIVLMIISHHRLCRLVDLPLKHVRGCSWRT